MGKSFLSFLMVLSSSLLAADSVYIYWFGHSLLGSTGVYRTQEFTVWKNQQAVPLYQELTNAGADYSYDIKQSWNSTHNKDSIALGPRRDGSLPWDYVIYNKLHSPLTADTFYKYQGLYIDTIKASGAIPIIYDDWVYVDATAEVLNICRAKGAYMVPVDTAYEWCLARYPGIHYKIDWAHAAEPLGYLAGALCWSSVFAVPTFGFDKVYPALSAEEAHLMQQVAWNFVTDSLFLPFQPWSAVPPLVKSIRFNPSPDTLEQYRTRQLSISTVFDNNATDSASHWAIFQSLDPGIVGVTYSGLATGVNLGTGRVVAQRERSRDTLILMVKTTTLTLDSVRILPRTFTSYLSNGFQFQAEGYFRDASQPVIRNVTQSVAWTSSNDTVFTVTEGRLQRQSGVGGSYFLTAQWGGKSDTVHFTLVPELLYINRINFQADGKVRNVNWKPDSGIAYRDSLGYGWLPGAYYYYGIQDDQGIDFYDSNFLRVSLVIPRNASNQNTWGRYHLNTQDGDFIIKAAMGHFIYPNQTCRLVFGTDTLINATTANGSLIKTVKDTIRVFGQSGIFLDVYGPIMYLVVASKQGVDIDSVALDQDAFILGSGTSSAEAFAPRGLGGLSVIPNPLGPRASIDFALPERSRVRLSVHDPGGRMVRLLRDGVLPPGAHRALWDGSDGRGRPLANGVYLVALLAGERRLFSKVVLLR